MSARIVERRRSRGLWRALSKGASAGIVAIGLNFLLRIGGLAPFPPEAATEAFIRIIPASIQEPSVQAVGDFAGELGLLVATAVAIAVYGIFGIIFEKAYAPRAARVGRLSRYEKFLVFSFIPWLFFGLVIFPSAGSSVFGISSSLASGYAIISFPLILLLVQLIYGVALYWEYKGTDILISDAQMPSSSSSSAPNLPSPTSRRQFLEKGALGVAALALAAVSLDQLVPSLLSGSGSNLPSGTSYDPSSGPAIFQDPRLAPLVNSEVTSNANFYRVAIDIFDPSVNAANWSLQLAGLIGTQKSYSIADLKNLPSAEQYTTFECVSNNVNGNLISNAKWSGMRISDLFQNAGGAQPRASWVVFYSVDGYSVGIPMSKAMMSDSILAYGMNDADLPTRHGYPLRAVIPGYYGMMSAKWINKIELADSPYSGYWQTRGWTQNAVVNTLAFISIPGDGASVSLSKNKGSVMLGGVAFAGDRGISKVEISVDGGNTWQEAQLKPPISNLTWSLWAYEWTPAKTGSYNVYARATDGTGALQTSVQTPTFPNGATGYAGISINVEI